MSDNRLARLEEIRIELGNIANSFSGKETGDIARVLHKASNQVTKATIMIEGDEEQLERFLCEEGESLHEEAMFEMMKRNCPGLFDEN